MKINVLCLIWGFFLINSIVCITLIILERRKPERTISWLLIFLLIPPIGMILYLFLGWNWKKHKLNSNKNFNTITNNFKVDSKIFNQYNNLINLVSNSGNLGLFNNNEIYIFNDGNEKFEALKEELLKARHHIHLEYYIVRSDVIGNEIKDILINKSKEGVNVKFIIDKVGSGKLKKSYVEELRENGVEVVFYSYFLAPIFKLINTQINFRNHRKIVVIDGKVGFTGGMNIGDEYLGKGNLGYWRDTHIMIKGDAVKVLQSIFLDDFKVIKESDKQNYEPYKFILEKEADKYFPEVAIGNKDIQIVKSGPNSKNPNIMFSILSMLYNAKDHIYITTPYFIPTESIMSALKIASISGVDVRILFPGRYDHFHVYYASRTYLKELAEEGCKIYFYDKDSFIHSKIICVDGNVSVIGTANMDIRSYELNYEVNTLIYDREKTLDLEKQFYYDLSKSKLVTIKDFNMAPYRIKVVEAFMRLFSNIL